MDILQSDHNLGDDYLRGVQIKFLLFAKVSEELPTFDELHDDVQLGLVLEGVGHVHQEREAFELLENL